MYIQEMTAAALDAKAIHAGKCFLCGGEASGGNGEHVFPKWLQRSGDLWDRKLTLLNGSLIPYRALRVPCCEECNTGPLSRQERLVDEIVKRGSAPTDPLELFVIGRWLIKVLIGTFFAEARLLLDRSNPDLGKIFPSERMSEWHTAHMLVNSSRKKSAFDCLHWNYPISVYAYNVTGSARFEDFDYRSNVQASAVSMRIGSIGVMATFDGGMQMEHSTTGPFGLAGASLHPFQFLELQARFHFKSSLRCATHKYLIHETPDEINFMQTNVVPFAHAASPLSADEEVAIFHPWEDRSFGRVADLFLGVTGWYVPEADQCRTCLVDESGLQVPPDRIELIFE